MINYAEALLKDYVNNFESLYGFEYISHNVHGLLHISQDARVNGVLDNFLAFKFDNYLQIMKSKLRESEESEEPLQQLNRRYSEEERCHLFMKQSSESIRFEKELPV